MNLNETRTRRMQVSVLWLLALVVLAEFASALQPGDVPYSTRPAGHRKVSQPTPTTPTQ